MARSLSKASCKTKLIGVKKEGVSIILKSSNPKPAYFKDIEIVLEKIAASYEWKK